MSDWSHEFDTSVHERLELKERLHALEAYEAELVRNRVVPDSRKLLVRRGSFLLHLLTAAALGIFIAMATVLVNFIVFTKILHV